MVFAASVASNVPHMLRILALCFVCLVTMALFLITEVPEADIEVKNEDNY